MTAARSSGQHAACELSLVCVCPTAQACWPAEDQTARLAAHDPEPDGKARSCVRCNIPGPARGRRRKGWLSGYSGATIAATERTRRPSAETLARLAGTERPGATAVNRTRLRDRPQRQYADGGFRRGSVTSKRLLGRESMLVILTSRWLSAFSSSSTTMGMAAMIAPRARASPRAP